MTQEAVKRAEEAIKINDELYNKIGNGDISHESAGHEYFSLVGFQTIQALKLTLEKLREEK